MASSPDVGVHLVRTTERVAEIDALAERLGGRVGLAGVLDDLNREARPARVPGLAVPLGLPLEPRGPAQQPVVAAGDHHLRRRVRHRGRRRPHGPGDQRLLQDVGGFSKGARLSFVDIVTVRRSATGTCCSWSRTSTSRPARPATGARARRRHRLARRPPARRRHPPRHRDVPPRRHRARALGRRPVTARHRRRRGARLRLPLRAAGPVRLRRGHRRGSRAAALLVPVAGPRARGRTSWSPASTAAAR